MNGLHDETSRAAEAADPGHPLLEPQAPVATHAPDRTTQGPLVATDALQSGRRYDPPRSRAPRPRRSLNNSRAPNGQAWSELFHEVDQWETGGTWPGAGRHPQADQPRPWPALPPPDGEPRRLDWRLTLAGLALAGLMGILFIG